ncbi:Sporulation-specific chitinase 2 [Trichophyton interdigitale]|uniref:chitinase n=1 Tax=Trichophyton interdigitale TaxID=101480 RepID=A0A9P5D085_9EURO|nr:Sporulation-specific chitinase 2 [Trichophyton interdigitale]KAF3898131.1 Sporulation-specific chitinase 2 [Trichophyton interdigitale]KAG8210323.1 Sporulation-specific chitinase 2 [Trichophyton interdigitale]
MFRFRPSSWYPSRDAMDSQAPQVGAASISCIEQSLCQIPIFSNAVYYPNWRIYKSNPPSSLKLGYVSHVFYAFAWVKPDGTVYLSDEWADEQMPVDGAKGCIRAFTQSKRQYPQLKVILSIGGGGAGSENFAAVAADPGLTANFVETAKNLVDKFSLDGLDVDWEHPPDPQQGINYISLLAALREQLPSPQYILSSALPAGQWALQHINLHLAQYYLDVINVMTYDFSGPWVPQCGHQSQLFAPEQPHNDAAHLSCSSAVSYLLAQGVPPHKILMGIPVYGRGFPGTNSVGQYSCPATDGSDKPVDDGAGNEKEVVFDYCDLPVPGSIEQHDPEVGNAAFCVDNEQNSGFISYDSPQSVKLKAQFVKQTGLAGLFYWHIAADSTTAARSLIATGYNTMHDL